MGLTRKNGRVSVRNYAAFGSCASYSVGLRYPRVECRSSETECSEAGALVSTSLMRQAYATDDDDEDEDEEPVAPDEGAKVNTNT